MNKKILQGIETKKRIVNCASDLFVKKGYYNVTVDEIIKKAGSSKGGFYTHFSSKKDLLLDMVPMVDEIYLEFLKLDLKPQSTIENLSFFIDYVLRTIQDKIGLQLITTIYSSQLDSLSYESFLISSDRKYYQLFTEFIEDGKKRNEIKQEISTEHIITVITTCIRGVIYDWCLKRGEFDIVKYGNEIVNIILNQIKI